MNSLRLRIDSKSSVCSGDHSGSGSGAGRWGAETGLFVHARGTPSPREAAERRQRRVAQVTPPILSPRPLMAAIPSQQFHWTVSVSSPSVFLFYFCFITLHDLASHNSHHRAIYCIFMFIIVCFSQFCLCFTFLPRPLIFYKLYFETSVSNTVGQARDYNV